MNHPEVDPVGLQTLELLLEHLECDLLVAASEGMIAFLSVMDADL